MKRLFPLFLIVSFIGAFLVTRPLIEEYQAKAGEEEGYDEPDMFAKAFYDIKVPYGKTAPEYEPGYRMRELERALAASERMPKNPALPWLERGPGNVPGRTRGLVVDVADATNKTWYAGSVGGGIWKTTNEGSTWRELTRNQSSLAISWLVQAQSNPDVFYAGTGESYFNVDVINGDGILKSTDHGETWVRLASTSPNRKFHNVSRVIVSPTDPNVVLASTTCGRYRLNFDNTSSIMKSTDGGATWREVFLSTEIGTNGRVKRVLQLVHHPANFNVQYAAVERKGVYKSTDAGNTWTFSSTGIDDVTGRFELAVAQSNQNKIYAAGEGTPNSNLYVSSDAGATWVKTAESGTEPNWLSAQGWYDNTIAVHPFDENTVYVGGVYLYSIVISGTSRTSTRLSTGSVHVDNHNIVPFAASGGSFRLLNGNDGGMGVSATGSSTWTKIGNGYNTSQFYGVDKMPGGSAYIGGMQDNGTWRSPVDPVPLSPWTNQIGGDGYEASWHFYNPSLLIGGSQYNGLARSTNGGTSFSSATSGLTETGSSSVAPFITKIAKTNMDPDFLCAVGKSGVWRSTNFGASWTLSAISSTLFGTIGSFGNVKISKSNPNIIWTGNRMDASGKILFSTNKGVSFTAANSYPRDLGGISGMATHPTKDSTAYVLFSFARMPHIIRTTNLGNTWEDITGFAAGDSVSRNGFPDVAVYDLLVMPHQPNTLWAGTEIGLFESTDNGVSWHIANNGLPNVSIWQLTAVEDEVVVATHGRGIWSAKMPELATAGTYPPLFKRAGQAPNGQATATFTLRSFYDSTVISVNSARFAAIAANNTVMKDTSLLLNLAAGTYTIQATSYKGGTAYTSLSRSLTTTAPVAPQNLYKTDFNTTNTDFTGTGFTISTPSGFANAGINNNTRPYPVNVYYTYQLKTPITVASSNAFLAYDDIALVEPGETGSVFGDDTFYDYVVVEGTKDGVNWVPLADGYDCRYDAAWLSAFNSNTNPTPAMFRHHEVNLLNKFAAGDIINVRFSLFSDPGVGGWGWIVDNLEIQSRLVDINEHGTPLPVRYELGQNYPNPFNPATNISFSLPFAGKVSLTVYNAAGEQVAVLTNKYYSAGTYSVPFNASGLSSGIYYYRIISGDFVQTRKMVVLK